MTKYTKLTERLIWVHQQTPLSPDNFNRIEDELYNISEFLESIQTSGMLLGKGVVIGDDEYISDEYTPDDDSLLTIVSGQDSQAAEFTSTYVSLLKSGETSAFLLSEDDGDITLNILDLFKVLKSSDGTNSIELSDAVVVGNDSIEITKDLSLSETMKVSMGEDIEISTGAVKLLSLDIDEYSIDLFEGAVQISETSAVIFNTSISEDGTTTPSLTAGGNTFTGSGIALTGSSSFTIGDKTLIDYIIDSLGTWNGGEY